MQLYNKSYQFSEFLYPGAFLSETGEPVVGYIPAGYHCDRSLFDLRKLK